MAVVKSKRQRKKYTRMVQKFVENELFMQTPLPILFVFFTLSGLIFFSLNLVLETIKKIINSNSKGVKS